MPCIHQRFPAKKKKEYKHCIAVNENITTTSPTKKQPRREASTVLFE